MAYNGQFTIPKRELGKADVEFIVSGDDGVIGTLKISKGSIVWFPKKTNYGRKVNWKEFHEIATNHFSDEEYRSGS